MDGPDDTPLPDVADLFEHAACGLLVTRVDGGILRANATFCRWTGHAAHELVGQRLQHLLTVGGRVFHQTHCAALLQAQGSVAELKLDVLHRDGHTVPMLLNAVRREHGGILRDELALMVVKDRHQYEQQLILARKGAETALSERHQAERELQESRDVLGLAMRAARMGIWTRDLVTGEVWWSRELEELVGLPEGGFVGTEAGFIDIVHPHDRASVADAVAQALDQKRDYAAEFRFRHAQGGWRWMEGRGRAAYDRRGRATTLYGLGIDITARKEAETALLRQAAIFEHQTDAIVVTDLKGRVIDFNPGCERMLGHAAADVLGKPVSMFHRPEEGRRLVAQVRAALKRDGEWRGEMAFVRRNGTQGVCESVVKPLAHAKGAVHGAVGVHRDITERRRAEDMLRHLNGQLSDADRRKDEFLATLAHELRNPLAPMRNVLELLRQKTFDDPQLNWAQEVLQRQLQHLTHLVDDLLEVSRITQGKFDLRRQRIELGSALHAAVESARPLVQAASHELVVTLPKGPVLLDADPTRLTQIILNLLNNAVKYTPAGGTIRLAAERRGRHAVISVRDSGIGIPKEHLSSVFEMFSQLTPALQRSQGGLGIGLSLVRGLVELHGGTVKADSAGPGLGSEFVVRLPACDTQELPHAEAVPGLSARHAGWRILVVDDNADAAESLAMLLTMQGHDLRMAGDGMAALALAESFAPRLVLLDIGLPRLNGYEVAARIRQAPWGRGMLLVAITGWGQAEDKKAAMAAGFDRHLTKPVDLAHLDAILASVAKAEAGGEARPAGNGPG
jgi:PAS domain S-box-containing protein